MIMAADYPRGGLPRTTFFAWMANEVKPNLNVLYIGYDLVYTVMTLITLSRFWVSLLRAVLQMGLPNSNVLVSTPPVPCVGSSHMRRDVPAPH